MAALKERHEDIIQIIGSSAPLLALLERTSQLSCIDKPVLIVGERGTGKELIAARLHYLSQRWEQPFIKVNCGALTETLLETELFGHEAGAFTGASQRHIGRFERADGGTLFLDELASVSMRVQEKILRAVEYGEFERVGGSDTLRVDVRLIGATNVDLPARVASGEFRADLLDRLAFEVLTVPPLRARREDVLELAEHFAINATSELGRSVFPGFSESAVTTLVAYGWPGNVRELKNAVERSVYRAEAEIPVRDIALDPFASPYRPHEQPTAEPAQPPNDGALPLPVDLKSLLAAEERRHAEAALAAGRYNQRRAAELLGLSYHQFRALLRRHGIRATD